ncbi:MAG: DMT family transporter [Dysgonamonadaceae bacterium]|jgi:drug/metabolite transporter (DMT)-like permease|nr:DMT family transporter [Dysgonamonadaceae bacterium]
MKLKSGWYHLIAFLTASVWGITFVSTKLLLNAGLSPQDILFYRFLLAYICILFFGKQRLFAKSLRDEGLFVLLGIFGGSLYFLTENVAVQITLASNVSLIVSIAPLLTTILSHFFLKNESLKRQVISGSLIAFMGVVLVVFNGEFILELNPAGDLFSALAAFCWAIYTILIKQVSNRYSTLFITRKVFFYGLLTCLPMFIADPLLLDSQILFQPVVCINLLFLGLVASLTCYFLWNICVKQIGAVYTTNYVYFVPLVTLATAFIVLHEHITIIALIGTFITMAGVYLANRPR